MQLINSLVIRVYLINLFLINIISVVLLLRKLKLNIIIL